MVADLVALLEQHDESAVRTAAAMALGRLVEPTSRPWSTALAAGLNYRAAVHTITDGHSGSMDQF